MPSFAFIFRFLLSFISSFIHPPSYISTVFITRLFLHFSWRMLYMTSLLFISLSLLSSRSKHSVLSYLTLGIIPSESPFQTYVTVSANPYSPSGPYSPKSLYFASSTHPNRSSKFRARDFQRFLTVRMVQSSIPRGFPQYR